MCAVSPQSKDTTQRGLFIIQKGSPDKNVFCVEKEKGEKFVKGMHRVVIINYHRLR